MADRFDMSYSRVAKRSSLAIWLLTGTMMVSLGTPALAQDAAQSAPQTATDKAAPENGQPALADIIVTAQKRSQNLQDVPISISVVSGAAIADQNYRSLQDLSHSQPAFSVAPVGRGARVSLRGVSSGTNSSLDQSVVTFVNDVYHGKARSSGALLLDIDRVELLKGPQTTFFGNNAIAGAINIQTARPRQDFEGSVRALYGQQGEYAGEAIVNTPVSSTLALRGAVLFNGLNGYITDRTGGVKVPHERNVAGRLSALWKPTSNFTLFLTAEATRNREKGGPGQQIVNCPPPVPFRAFPATNQPPISCPAIAAGGYDAQLNYVRDQTPGQALNLDTQDYQANAALDLGWATLTSETGFSHFSFVNIQDVDGAPAPSFGLRAPQHYNQFSQELRIASNDAKAPLSYIAGAYFQTSRFHDVTELAYSFLTPVLATIPPFAGLPTPLGQVTDSSQNERTLSAFASVTWRPIEPLSLTAGARYTSVRKHMLQAVYYGQAANGFGNITPYTGANAAAAGAAATALALGAPVNRDLRRTDDKFTPTVNAEYKLARNINVYASFSKGFKAGGFNGTLVVAPPSGIGFDPETVTAYEVGFRSELFDRRLLFNVSAFHSAYNNLQVSVFVPSSAGTPLSVVQNAASSISRGIELESKLALTRSLSVGTAMTFLDSHFKSFPAASPTAFQKVSGATSQDLSGQPTAFAPKFAASFYAEFKHPITDALTLAFDASLLHQSKYFTTDQDDSGFPGYVGLAQKAYEKLDLRAALSTADDHWEIAVIAKNVTNALIITSATDSANPGSYFVNVDRPRSVVGQIRYKW
ncbi:outer membrane receptor protein involved in Fe transport [Sphingomonas vulcanisoli]|uniref:Outer membrane receptor protein involved in Fe transport n=1 Tax=Sphingomonas vulcanisoli TaxID=1658060 RepID=A0ABX0TXW6_9SPHN|nr:TonB-dependent receptor [Sphingomonas vulcanisoli]NIJ09569.1 outer membrane receptor protein involved in Fe transport [Sphingomonas vulcanisoli]